MYLLLLGMLIGGIAGSDPEMDETERNLSYLLGGTVGEGWADTETRGGEGAESFLELQWKI